MHPIEFHQQKLSQKVSYKRLAITLLLIQIPFSLAACSTIKVHAYDHDILHPYLGTKTAVKAFVNSFSDYYIFGQQFLMAIDVPFCFAADTLLFPYDLIVRSNRHSHAKQQADEG